MPRPRAILAIASKDLRVLFATVTGFLILAVVLALWIFFFFRNALLVGEASLRGLFDLLPWMSVLLIPAVTMGSFAQERSEGTMETLATHPVKNTELLFGKIVGSWIVGLILLAGTLPLAATFAKFGSLDLGATGAQYGATAIFLFFCVCIGVLVSAWMASPLSAMLVSAAALLLVNLLSADFVTARIPAFALEYSSRLSPLTPYRALLTGAIDLGSILFFASASIVIISWSLISLSRARTSRSKRSIIIALAACITLVIMAADAVPLPWNLRVDLTADKRYTLNQATLDTLAALDKPVDITLYVSNTLPPQLLPRLRETRDLLADIKRSGRGRINAREKNPVLSITIAEEAKKAGVPEAQFNMVSRDEYKVEKAYFGMALAQGSSTLNIPFLPQVSNLEYQVVSAIRQLALPKTKTVRLLTGHGEETIANGKSLFVQALQSSFKTEPFAFSTGTIAVPTGTEALVIAGPRNEVSKRDREAIKKYLDEGGAVFLMLDGLKVDTDMNTALPATHPFAEFLADDGISLLPGVVFDTRSHDRMNLQSNGKSYLQPYPFWVRAGIASRASPATIRIPNALYPWGSAISLDAEKIKNAGWKITPLLMTSPGGGRKEGNASIAPDAPIPTEKLGPLLLALQMEKDLPNGKHSRVVVVGTTVMLMDIVLQAAPENLAFGLGAVSWLTQESTLASLQAKTSSFPRLQFSSAQEVAWVRYGNLAAVAIVPLLVAGMYLAMRKRKAKKVFAA